MSSPTLESDRPARGAFTLVELLVVVAVIAILAAIAVPNFLEAQTRGKVVRARSDMRSLVVAVESYHVDHGAYPIPSDAHGAILLSASEPWFETKAGPSITTPVAYISTRPPDPFHPPSAADEDPVYHLLARDYAALAGAETAFDAYVAALTGAGDRFQFALPSHGPDLDHDDPEAGSPVLYDPTNGTASNGDVLFFGPSGGFGR